MLSTAQLRSRSVHPLERFVTKEAIALLLNLHPDHIYRIDCWRYVIHVVGKGISTFVSYADIPPILDVEPPTLKDIIYWRKRWRNNNNQAPGFWIEFYKQKFKLAPSVSELYRWGELLNLIKFALSGATLQFLRTIYTQEKDFLQNF